MSINRPEDAEENRRPRAAFAADGGYSNPEQQRVLVPLIADGHQRLEGADESPSVPVVPVPGPLTVPAAVKMESVE